MIYGSWDMEWDEQKFLSFWTIFCPFTPATTQKIKILKQWKKPGDTIILNKCTINYNSMMYDSWDMEWDRQNFLSFWTISWPFIAPTPKIKILKQWKKTLEISSFYSSAPKIMIICYTVHDIWPVTELIFIFHFKTIACPFKPPNDSKNQN